MLPKGEEHAKIPPAVARHILLIFLLLSGKYSRIYHIMEIVFRLQNNALFSGQRLKRSTQLMKKRIPIFSALVFLYGAISAFQHLSNTFRTFSIMLSGGQLHPSVFSSMITGLIPAAIMIALGVLAILIVEKPHLTKIAGILSLVWAGWNALNLVSGLSRSLQMMGGDFNMILQLLGNIPKIVITVIWLILSIKMMQGKIEPKKAPTFMQAFCIIFLFVLCSAFTAIAQTGGSNVAGILINAVIKCIPMVALYFAGNLLHISFHTPQEAPLLKQQHVKTIVTYAVVIAIILAVSFACNSSGGSGGGRGDGVNTCRNCGRDVPLVAGFGFCGTCYEGFVDWQETSWRD